MYVTACAPGAGLLARASSDPPFVTMPSQPQLGAQRSLRQPLQPLQQHLPHARARTTTPDL